MNLLQRMKKVMNACTRMEEVVGWESEAKENAEEAGQFEDRPEVKSGSARGRAKGPGQETTGGASAEGSNARGKRKCKL